MSLNYDLKKIEGHEVLCYTADGQVDPVTNSLIWATMALDIGEITEQNAAEFYARYKLWTAFVGPFWCVNGDPVKVTAEDIVTHIGLKTNVVNRTRHYWFARMLNPQMNDVMNDVNKILAIEV